MVTIELTDEQLSVVRMALSVYVEQLALESRESTYSAIVERRLALLRQVRQKITQQK